MKSEKGITLTSLVIYVVMLFIIIIMLGVIRNNFQNTLKDISEESNIESEFNKFNIYFAKDAKMEGNTATLDGTNKIIFSSGNSYEFNSEEKKVYFKNSEQEIIILKDINNCTFSIDTSTGKTTITVSVSFDGTDSQITKEYTLVEENTSFENEEDYITFVE